MGKKKQQNKKNPQEKPKKQTRIKTQAGLIQRIAELQLGLSKAVNQNDQLRERIQQLEAVIIEAGQIIKRLKRQKNEAQSETQNLTPCKTNPYKTKMISKEYNKQRELSKQRENQMQKEVGKEKSK